MKAKQKSSKKIRVLNANTYGDAKIFSISDAENGGKKIIFSFLKHGDLCLGVLLSHSFLDKDQVNEWVELTKKFLASATSKEISKRVADAHFMEKTLSAL